MTYLNEILEVYPKLSLGEKAHFCPKMVKQIEKDQACRDDLLHLLYTLDGLPPSKEKKKLHSEIISSLENITEDINILEQCVLMFNKSITE